MEIMRHIKNVYEKKRLLHYIYFYAPFFLFLIFFIYECCVTKADGGIGTILQYSVFHILLLAVIYIWLRVTPNYYDYLYNLENAFDDNAEYREAFHRFVHWTEQFNLSYSSKSSWLKAVYFMGYLILGVSFIVCVNYLELLPAGGMGYTAVFFIVITQILNFSSYFTCMAFTFFIIRVTHIKDLKYNIYIPSATYGFRQIRKAANITYLFFLVDSFLCIFAYTYYVYLFASDNDLLKSNILIYLFIYVSCYMGILGLWSFFIITFRVKFYLNRMFNSWKENSIKYFQDKLYSAQKNSDEMEINNTNEIIRYLRDDRMSISRIEVVVSLSTFAINIISIVKAVVVLLGKL